MTHFETSEPIEEKSPEHLITPANLLTAARPVMALEVAHRIATGRRHTTALMLATVATDAEGTVARLVEKAAPNSGYGLTELGAAIDPIADSMAFMEIAAGALVGRRVSLLGKLGVGLVVATEGVKAKWAVKANAKHKAETGERLVIKPSGLGKAATDFKFAALFSAVRTHELEPGTERTVWGIASLATAAVGTVLGEKARRSYQNSL